MNSQRSPVKSQKIFSKQTFSQSDSKLKDSRKDTVYKERRSFSKSRWVSQPFWAKSWMENKFLEKHPKISYRSQSSNHPFENQRASSLISLKIYSKYPRWRHKLMMQPYLWPRILESGATNTGQKRGLVRKGFLYRSRHRQTTLQN